MSTTHVPLLQNRDQERDIDSKRLIKVSEGRRSQIPQTWARLPGSRAAAITCWVLKPGLIELAFRRLLTHRVAQTSSTVHVATSPVIRRLRNLDLRKPPGRVSSLRFEASWTLALRRAGVSPNATPQISDTIIVKTSTRQSMGSLSVIGRLA